MSKSSIEWTSHTWNPVVGCSIVSPGCTNCYAMKQAARCEAMGTSRYDGTTKRVKGKIVWTGKLARGPEATLLGPLRRKKPTMYFVNSMSDLFHEDCPDEWIDQVFAVMALCPQHTFQVLTKRAERMRQYLAAVAADYDEFSLFRWADTGGRFCQDGDLGFTQIMNAGWPLPNVWLGISAERQQEWDERYPLLKETPASIRFVSYEPALGPLDIFLARIGAGGPHLDWLICGGESGSNARPMNPQWARDIRDQCRAAGIAFFHKQNGEWASVSEVEGPGKHFHFPDGRTVRRVGKKAAGRLLDGVEHNAMPRVLA